MVDHATKTKKPRGRGAGADLGPSILSAKGWSPPFPEQISDIIKESGRTQRYVAEHSGIKIDRIKRLIGRKASKRAGSAPTPCSFGEWLALVVATSPGAYPHPHPGGHAAGAALELLMEIDGEPRARPGKRWGKGAPVKAREPAPAVPVSARAEIPRRRRAEEQAGDPVLQRLRALDEKIAAKHDTPKGKR